MICYLDRQKYAEMGMTGFKQVEVHNLTNKKRCLLGESPPICPICLPEDDKQQKQVLWVVVGFLAQ